ncbi:cytidylyltransferase domain-containing protein [Rummeliibacillus sp. NPDC094406]|uniref:cytidylyltransferase domain-containing protein n=1 Tax=Rummeliibacillus sp. NPDC094406 TaxID=3364511 RepID=UPI00382F7324
MSVSAIIQARMGSSRLPGKILKEVNGKPLLLHQIERLRQCKEIDQLIIATTVEEQDNQIFEFCNHHNVSIFRGSENNVLERYYETWKQFGGDVIVRLTSDCPIIDYKIVDKTIRFFLDNEFDYVSNTIERTFPRGLDTEVFSVATLETTYKQAKLERDKEHVTAYIYTHPEKFKIGSYKGEINYSKYRWTVDTEEDFALIKNLFEAYKGKENQLDLASAVRLMEQNPAWFLINEHIEQKKI